VRDASVNTNELQDLYYRSLLNPQTYEQNARTNAAAATEVMFDDFERVRVPLLLLARRYSAVFGPGAAKRIASRFSDARVVAFEESGHALQLEEPARFAEVVGDFQEPV
jgi:pimeloyl-ACP methyl ester carboxylesterase